MTSKTNELAFVKATQATEWQKFLERVAFQLNKADPKLGLGFNFGHAINLAKYFINRFS